MQPKSSNGFARKQSANAVQFHDGPAFKNERAARLRVNFTSRMRYAVLMITVLLSLGALAAADTIRVIVNEGICHSCLKDVETVFRAQPQIESAHFDPDNNMLTIQTKHGQTLGDAKLERLVTNAGYTVVRIIRQK